MLYFRVLNGLVVTTKILVDSENKSSHSLIKISTFEEVKSELLNSSYLEDNNESDIRKKKKKSNEIIFVWFCFCRWTHYQLKRSAIGENNQWENQLPWPWKYLHVAYRCITWWLFIITHHGSYYCLTKKKTETNKLKCR